VLNLFPSSETFTIKSNRQKAVNGHCNVHRACACCLGQWVNNQRQSKTNGKLSAERIEQLLDGLSFGWSRVRN